ncbi:MAG: hypothetical protein Q8Q32_02135 [bacterium]|nr:hypothetical protein [bacterium]
MKKVLLFLIFSLIFSGQVFAQSQLGLPARVLTVNAAQADVQAGVGFIQGNIWFSKSPFFAGDNIRIYTAILNSEDEDVIGTIDFFDNGTKIGTTDFQAAQGASLEQVWIDWTASEGEHNIYAQISQLKLSLPGGETKSIEPSSTKSGEVVIEIDLDTDKDGIGNREDKDDDNDGLSDEEERAMGTNPLEADSDGDGLSDKEEMEKSTNPLDKDSDNDGILDGEDENPASKNENTEEPAQEEAIQEKAKEIAKDTALETKNTIDKFATYQSTGLAEEKTRTKRKLELIRGTAKPETEEEQKYLDENQKYKNKGVFLRSYLILLSLLEALFKFKPVLYVLLLLIIWKLLHWLFKWLRRNKGSYDEEG